MQQTAKSFAEMLSWLTFAKKEQHSHSPENSLKILKSFDVKPKKHFSFAKVSIKI